MLNKFIAYSLVGYIPILWIIPNIMSATDRYDKALELTGIGMVITLSLAILIGPISRLLKLKGGLLLRQPVGLSAATWVAAHVFSYFVFNQLEFMKAINDVITKPSLLLGGVAMVILLLLSMTSHKQLIKILRKRWTRLHSMVVVAAALGAAHGLSLQKITFTEAGVWSLVLLAAVLLRYVIPMFKGE